MLKNLITGCCLSFCFFLISCQPSSPKGVAKKFLRGFYRYDFESAKSVATEETGKLLDLMSVFASKLSEEERKAAEKTEIEITAVKEENNKAVVTYKISDDPEEKSIRLIRERGDWLVHFTKEDYFSQMHISDEEIMEEINRERGIDSLAKSPQRQ